MFDILMSTIYKGKNWNKSSAKGDLGSQGHNCAITCTSFSNSKPSEGKK